MGRKFVKGLPIALFLGLIIFSPTAAGSEFGQKTTIINVGQGDSILIQDGNGFDVLIDGGKPEAGPTVLAYLRSEGITELEIIIASHADSDHVGGLITVLQASDITIGQVLYNGYPGDTITWSNFVSAVTADGLVLTPIQFPADITWGNMQAHILNPIPGLSDPAQNDASVVIRLDYGTTKQLFTGDISFTVESEIIARQTPISSNLLKVAHHGSEYSTSSYFLAAAIPTYAGISVGPNSYGHPSQLTLDRLNNSGVSVYRTDIVGNLIFYSDGTNLTFEKPFVEHSIFLPIISNSQSEPVTPTPETPTPTTETSTPTPVTPTPPTPTEPTPVPTTGNIAIVSIFYDGVNGSAEPDEYVLIQNQDPKSIQIQNWTLSDVAGHVFTFPNFLIQPGQYCRIYTNIYDPSTCGFSYRSGWAIWNNTGDTAYLRDSSGALISQKSY